MQVLATLFKAHSNDPCIFVAEKQPQGTEGRSVCVCGGRDKSIPGKHSCDPELQLRNIKEARSFFNQFKLS